MLSTKQQTCIKVKDTRALYRVTFQIKSSFLFHSLCYVKRATSLLGPSPSNTDPLEEI